MAFDIYTAVTDRIISQLEQGIIPWNKPWTGLQSGAISGTTGKPYSMLNQMLLSKPGEYYTFNQIQKLGGKIRKGEKCSMVVFWKQLPIKEKDPETGETVEKVIPMLKYFNVFHVDQCEGIDPKTVELPDSDPATDEAADAIIADYILRSGITLEHEAGDRAYYTPTFDKVVLPLREQFSGMEEYYSTAFHELTHSTGHTSRLNRLTSTAHFGNQEYSKEELVAEIGAAALLNHVGIESAKSFKNSTAYIQSWLRVLKNDKRMIVSASSQAAKAFALITNTAE
jgi:antirestriction protein ArdC